MKIVHANDDDAELPLELRLDLLVDQELPERERRELLLALDKDPGRWRDLSIRFLERQVEHKSVRDLMAGGRLVPVEVTEGMAGRARGRFNWMRDFRVRAVAAGLMVAAVSAVVTHELRHGDVSHEAVAPSPAVANARLSGESMGWGNNVAVQVPVVNVEQQGRAFFGSQAGGAQGRGRRTLVIQPDGAGNAVVIPVNTLSMKVY